MIEQICAFIHNFFYGDRYAGEFVIADGALTVPGLLEGQYFRICGSRLNDGVYKYGVDVLADETFTGVIWDMRPPRAFLSLVDDIEAWQQKYGAAVMNPYSSESFETYSRTMGSVSNGRGGSEAPTWQTMFRSSLNQYRKLA